MTKKDLQPKRDSYTEYMETQMRLLNQMKRELHNWENYEKQNPSKLKSYLGRNWNFEIYQIMLNLSHEFVHNFNNNNKQ
jgi:hypothetical protein